MKVTSTGLTEDERILFVKAFKNLYPQIEYNGNLDSDVKILVINSLEVNKSWIRSPKFQYVVSYRPDVIVLTLEYVLTMFRSKTKNIKFKVPHLLDLPSMKVFEDLTISACRLEEDISIKVRNLLESNGGVVSASLSSETNLMISMFSEGKRYETALKWGIPVVSPDWCYDSIERGLILNPKWYILTDNFTKLVTKVNYEGDDDKNGTERTVKVYKMGKKDEACDWEKLYSWKKEKERFKLEERVRLIIGEETAKSKTGKSFDDLHRINLKRKHDDENQTLVEKPIKKENHETENEIGKDDDEEEERRVPMKRFSQSQSKKQLILKRSMQPITRSLSTGLVKPNNKSEMDKSNVKKGALFAGLRFRQIGFTDIEKTKLKKVLAKFGGLLVTADSCDYTIVNFKWNQKVDGDNLITDLAIERFLYFNEMKNVHYLWCKPFVIDNLMTVKNFRKSFFGHALRDGPIRIALTGYTGTNLLHLERLLKERFNSWFELRETFNKDCELLLLETDGKKLSPVTHSGRKQVLATKWKVRILSAEQFFNKVLFTAKKN